MSMAKTVISLMMKRLAFQATYFRHAALTAMALLPLPSAAQTRYELRRHDAPADSYESVWIESRGVESASMYILQAQPSLVGILAKEAGGARTLIRLDGACSHTRGDFVHYEGRRNAYAAVTAGGQRSVNGVGTLYGRVSYSRSTRRGAYQNYAESPSDYAPYMVGDTVSDGATGHERYFVSGGLSRTSGSWHYGVSGLYDGTTASKESQPKRSVYSYWLRVALSAAKTTPKTLFAVKVWPEINKQSISAYGTKTSYRYLQSYGLGQWNRKESASGYSYGRDMRILGIGAEAVFRLLPMTEKSLDATFSIGYNRRDMQTEEASFKNLYATTSRLLTHKAAVSRAAGGRFGIHLLLQGELLLRSGRENVYESRKQDGGQNLYDYVLAGFSRPYHLAAFRESLQLKAVRRIAGNRSVSVGGGARLECCDESYDAPKMGIRNLSATADISFGYSQAARRSRIETCLTGSCRMAAGNDYGMEGGAAGIVETAQAYIPYLIRGENRIEAGFSVTYSHALGSGSVGVDAEAEYLRRTAAPFVPGRATGFGTNRDRWAARVGLFYMF